MDLITVSGREDLLLGNSKSLTTRLAWWRHFSVGLDLNESDVKVGFKELWMSLRWKLNGFKFHRRDLYHVEGWGEESFWWRKGLACAVRGNASGHEVAHCWTAETFLVARARERGKTFLITIINKRAKQNLIRGFSAINLQQGVVIRILSFAQLRFSLSLEISPLAPLKLNALRDPSQKLNEFRCGFDLEYTAENAQHTSWHNLLRHRLECVVTLQFSSVLHVVVRRLVADVIKRTVFVYIIC